jgi:hypothetical protein
MITWRKWSSNAELDALIEELQEERSRRRLEEAATLNPAAMRKSTAPDPCEDVLTKVAKRVRSA